MGYFPSPSRQHSNKKGFYVQEQHSGVQWQKARKARKERKLKAESKDAKWRKCGRMQIPFC